VVEYKEFRNEVKSIAGSDAAMGGAVATTKAGTDPNLQKLVNDMWSADKVNRAAPEDVTLNWGRHIKWGNNGSVMAPAQPLFSFVNETLFEDNPLYRALIGIYNNTDLFHPPVCTTEPSTVGDRLDTFSNFLYQVTNTTVFKKAYQYLYSKGKGGESWDAFYPQLFDMWFGTYSRCETTIGSSGWEHVFCGELRESIVDGHHNWVRYYLEQKAGNVQYHGYYDHTPDEIIGTIQYKWRGHLKKIGGFFFRTSPAFDLSLFTVCSLVYPGDTGCSYEINGSGLYVSSFFEHCKDRDATCLSTSYPVIGKKKKSGKAVGMGKKAGGRWEWLTWR